MPFPPVRKREPKSGDRLGAVTERVVHQSLSPLLRVGRNVSCPVLGELLPRGEPHAWIGQEVLEQALEHQDPPWAPDQLGMHGEVDSPPKR